MVRKKKNINIYNLAQCKMSLTLSAFVVVYQTQAYSGILGKGCFRLSGEAGHRVSAELLFVVCFVVYLYASQVFVNKMFCDRIWRDGDKARRREGGKAAPWQRVG